MRLYEQNIDTSQLVLPALDTALLFAVFHLTEYTPAGRVLRHAGLVSYPSLLFVGFVLSWGLLAHHYANVYRPNRLTSYGQKIGYVWRTVLLHAGLVALGVLLLGNQLAPLPLLVPYLATLYLGVLVAIPVGRCALAFTFRAYRRYLAPRRHIIVGVSPSGLALHHWLSGRQPGGNGFMGFFVEDPEEVPAPLRHLVRGTVAAIPGFCDGNRVDELYFALPLDRQVLLGNLAEYAAAHRVTLRLVPDFASVGGQLHGRLPLRLLRRVLLRLGTSPVAKRCLDIVVSSLVIGLVLSWALPVLALLIKLDSRGPVLVAQPRAGRRNQLFLCYKLRTTWPDPARPELLAARLTRVGRYLQRYSLDELPQVFNVLLGHMSVVGLRAGGAAQAEAHSSESSVGAPRPVLLPRLVG